MSAGQSTCPHGDTFPLGCRICNLPEAAMSKDKEFPPRLKGAEVPGEGWHASNTLVPPDYCAFEFISKAEHESLLAAKVEEARREAMRDAIKFINEVQCSIAIYTRGSPRLLEVWNRNARFLSDHFDDQSAYLASLAKASEGASDD